MPQAPKTFREFASLVKIVEALRGPDGCPWDKEQNHQSLTRFAIEEAHELADAIDAGLDQNIVEELGDLLLQVVLHAEIARQEGRFNIEDVITSIGEKMVRRHPHVFADVKVSGSNEVLENWNKIKAAEKGKTAEFVEFNLPSGLPALIGAHKIGEKTKKWNFDWRIVNEVVAKLDEEVAELKAAIKSKKPPEIEHEIGDLLFTVAQLGRHLDLDGETALRKTNQRFESRFRHMQELCQHEMKHFGELTPAQLEEYWQRAKAAEKKS